MDLFNNLQGPWTSSKKKTPYIKYYKIINPPSCSPRGDDRPNGIARSWWIWPRVLQVNERFGVQNDLMTWTMKSWLVYRDPYIGLSVLSRYSNWVVQSPISNNQPGFWTLLKCQISAPNHLFLVVKGLKLQFSWRIQATITSNHQTLVELWLSYPNWKTMPYFFSQAQVQIQKMYSNQKTQPNTYIKCDLKVTTGITTSNFYCC